MRKFVYFSDSLNRMCISVTWHHYRNLALIFIFTWLIPYHGRRRIWMIWIQAKYFFCTVGIHYVSRLHKKIYYTRERENGEIYCRIFCTPTAVGFCWNLEWIFYITPTYCAIYINCWKDTFINVSSYVFLWIWALKRFLSWPIYTLA
jgi:hypothetical protein